MKKLFSILLLAVIATSVQAQGQGQGRGQGRWQRPPQGEQQFSPEKFEAQMQEFITKEAKLTPEDAAKFFPLYKEMQDKQRKLFARQRELANVKPSDEQGCLNVIKESDEIDLELKRIQQNYHKRFISMLSASKLYDIMQAEQRFYRHMMRDWGRGGGQFGQFGGQFGQFGQWPQQNRQGQQQNRQWPQQQQNGQWQRPQRPQR